MTVWTELRASCMWNDCQADSATDELKKLIIESTLPLKTLCSEVRLIHPLYQSEKSSHADISHCDNLIYCSLFFR